MILAKKLTHGLSTLAIIGLLGICTACDSETGGDATISGSNHGHVDYDAHLHVKFRFLAPGTPTPNYSIRVQGYPYNRILLMASLVSTNSSDGTSTTTPMQLIAGSQFPVTVTIAGFSQTYTTTIVTNSAFPAGTYILDAPGIVQDVQSALQDYPGASMSLALPITSNNGGTGGAMLPAAQQSIDTPGSTNLTLNFASNAMVPWSNLTTTWTPHGGPYTQTQ